MNGATRASAPFDARAPNLSIRTSSMSANCGATLVMKGRSASHHVPMSKRAPAGDPPSQQCGSCEGWRPRMTSRAKSSVEDVAAFAIASMITRSRVARCWSLKLCLSSAHCVWRKARSSHIWAGDNLTGGAAGFVCALAARGITAQAKSADAGRIHCRRPRRMSNRPCAPAKLYQDTQRSLWSGLGMQDLGCRTCPSRSTTSPSIQGWRSFF
jgi:hypothetical protein